MLVQGAQIMATPEGKVKDAAVKLYKKHNAKYDRAAQTGMGKNGRPDDLVRRAPDGHFIGVEAKKLDVFEVTKLQQIWLDDCAAGGGSSMVLNMTTLPLLDFVLGSNVRVVAHLERKNKGALCTGHTMTDMATGETRWVPTEKLK